MTSATLSAVGALTAELIERPSVTPDDAGCLDLIGGRLAALGFDLVRLPRGGVDNLWAVRGTQGPCFAFAGHTDVVPPGPLDSWTSPPFTPTVDGDMLRGRGAADMKGSLAAMVVAVERYLAQNPCEDARIAFILTSDEEGPATDGTVRVMEYLEQSAVTIDWCVVGEPSTAHQLGDTIRVGRRGSLNGHLIVRGVQGHVAYPDRADNPIHRALPALAELAARSWDTGNAFYPPTSFQVSNLVSGTGAENVIPPSLEARFNFRYCTASTASGLQAELHAVLDRHGLEYDLAWNLSGVPFLTTGGALVAAAQEAIEAQCGISTTLSTGGGTSDGRFIAPRGIELIELGPNNATIHKIDEWVSLRELDALSRLYENIMARLLPA